MGDVWPFLLMMMGGIVLIGVVFFLAIGDSSDGRKTVYCARGGHVLVIPDANDQHYAVKCVRTTNIP